MQFQIFEPYKEKLFCEITNRHQGVSQEPYESLNLALHVGDDPISVIQNRTILAKEYNFIIENLIYMEQTHSDNIQIIQHSAHNKIKNCDAIITNKSNIPLLVMVADCIPIMMYDPVQSVIAAVHAGRNGTFKNIAVKTILKMQQVFNTNPKDVLIGFGASIHVCCYEVGKDLVDITIKNFGKKYIQTQDKKRYLDLQTLNYDQLLQIGVNSKNIEISPVCSCCDKNYFSYRREGTTGRFGGIIKLR